MAARVLKLLCVFFAVVSVLLCGCDKRAQGGRAPLCVDFTADFAAKINGVAAEGSLSNVRQGVLTIELSSPETLSGLSVRCKSGETAISRGDIMATADEAYLPCSSLPSLLRELFTTVQKGDYRRMEEDTYTVALSCGDCTLTAGDDLLPKSANVPAAGCKIEFRNAEKIGE